ncbi:MAG TPA: AhpC-related (seleno)protein [Labilithrix sp.]|nr:AhpC-related (seleno)protein [Labilithrix sp.]
MNRSLYALVALTLLGCAAETSGAGSFTQEEAEAELPPQTKIEDPGTTPPGTDGELSQGQFSLPSWMRVDVQPKSARFQQTYGLEAFRGKAMVVVLLEGYCPFCQSNSKLAQELNDELSAEGYDAQVVVLADGYGSEFASRVTLPIFNDPDKSAWREMRPNAYKHDTYVFAPSGERTWFKAGTYRGEPGSWKAETGAAVRAVATKR